VSVAALVEWLFWAAAVLLFWTWAGHPFLMRMIAARRRDEPRLAEPPPSLTIVVAAFNEERCIREKLANLMTQDYPSGSVEVVVVSDGSTDGTAAAVSGFPDPRVRLVEQERRGGKNLALNAGAAAARGEILVFTDADAMLEPSALARLAAGFSDPDVGLVSGQGLYGVADEVGVLRAVSNGYARFEGWLKSGESRLGFLAGADGALYAMRRHLFEPLRADQVHDLAHPVQVALAGARCLFEPRARTVEPPSTGSDREWGRQVRMAAQGWALVADMAPLLLRRGRYRELGLLVAHRVLRWSGVAPLLAAAVCSAALGLEHTLYAAVCAAQVLFYGAAAVGALAERLGVAVPLLGFPQVFCLVALAGAAGFLEYLAGRRHSVWRPTGDTGGAP